jgi:hypothetical protein
MTLSMGEGRRGESIRELGRVGVPGGRLYKKASVWRHPVPLSASLLPVLCCFSCVPQGLCQNHQGLWQNCQESALSVHRVLDMIGQIIHPSVGTDIQGLMWKFKGKM